MQTQVEIEYEGSKKFFTLKTVGYEKWEELQRIILPRIIRQDGQMEILSSAMTEYNKKLILASIEATGSNIDLSKVDAIGYQILLAKATEVHTLTAEKEKN